MSPFVLPRATPPTFSIPFRSRVPPLGQTERTRTIYLATRAAKRMAAALEAWKLVLCLHSGETGETKGALSGIDPGNPERIDRAVNLPALRGPRLFSNVARFSHSRKSYCPENGSSTVAAGATRRSSAPSRCRKSKKEIDFYI